MRINSVVWLVIGCSCLFLAACASAPRSTGYPYSLQQNMQSVSQWQALAQQVVATQVAPPPEAGVRSTALPNPTSIYIDNSDQTEFGKAFRGYLATELVHNGITPTSDPSADAVIKWGTQLVWNNKDAVDFINPGLIGFFEVFAATFFGTLNPEPHPTIEVIVTTQVEKRGRLSRESHNFYINDGDEWNFCEPGRKCVPRMNTVSATN